MAREISSTARSKRAWLAREGARVPLTLRTYWSAAARISASVAGGWKLKSTRMLRHMPRGYTVASTAPRAALRLLPRRALRFRARCE